MKVKLWGVRGSIPSPLDPQVVQKKITHVLKEYQAATKHGAVDIDLFVDSLPVATKMGYGGNTACISVTTSMGELIVDGGSGIRRLGEGLLAGPCGKGQGKVHILFTHFHWDHVVGLPFFVPFFIPGNEVHLYSVSPGLEETVRKMFSKPNFPVPFERLGAKIVFHELEPREEVTVNGIKFSPYQLDHPDPCWGYRFEDEGKVFSYCVDTEGTRVSQKELGKDLPLYQGVDLMVFDAQYTFVEAAEKIDWGHATAPIGLDIAIREEVKKILFVHHDPAASDEKVAQAEQQTHDYLERKKSLSKQMGESFFVPEWCFAHEGMEIEV